MVGWYTQRVFFFPLFFDLATCRVYVPYVPWPVQDMYDALVLALPNDKEAPQVFFTEPHQKNTWLRERWQRGGSFRVESGYYAVFNGVIWDEMGLDGV